MSATGVLESSLTRHMIYLQRYGAGINNDQRELFKELAASSRSLLNDNLTSFAETRLRVTIRQLDALIDEAFDVYSPAVLQEIKDLAEYEAGFQLNALQAVMRPSMASVPVERLEALLTTSKMKLVSGQAVKEFTLDEMFEDFRLATKSKSAEVIRNTINTGVANGDSVDVIARRVSRVVGNTIGLPNSTIQTWSKTNILTAVNHVSQQARNELVQANSDYLEFEKWSSTLDINTSLTCISRDGKKYRVGQGDYPPAHHRCRSARLPWIPDEYAIIKTSERASAFGPVDSRTTYGGWLKKQAPEFQDDVLGVERAKLFRSGKVSVDKFTDSEGKTLTLKKLAQKEGLTLGKATRTRKVKKPTESEFIKSTSPAKKYRAKVAQKETIEIPDPTTKLSTAKPPKNKKLSIQEVGEIEYYKGQGYFEMNSVLRNKKSHSASRVAEMEARNKRLGNIIGKNKTTKDHQFYRGVRSEGLFENAESLVGKTLKNPTVQSTTFDKDVAKNYAGLMGGYSAQKGGSVVMKINVKKGTGALNISDYTSINAQEREILLGGNSAYKVKSVNVVKDPNGNIAYKEIEVDYDNS